MPKYYRTAGAIAAITLAAFAVTPSASASPSDGVTILGVPPAPASATRPAAQPARKQPLSIVDSDAAGRQPFQAQVSLSLTNNVVAVPIPAGKRLVIEHIESTAAAASASGPVQPYVTVFASQPASGQATYLYVENPLAALPQQFSVAQQVTLYTDTLYLGIAFAGYTPTYISMGVTVSGHLITP